MIARSAPGIIYISNLNSLPGLNGIDAVLGDQYQQAPFFKSS